MIDLPSVVLPLKCFFYMYHIEQCAPIVEISYCQAKYQNDQRVKNRLHPRHAHNPFSFSAHSLHSPCLSFCAVDSQCLSVKDILVFSFCIQRTDACLHNLNICVWLWIDAFVDGGGKPPHISRFDICYISMGYLIVFLFRYIVCKHHSYL